MEGNMISYMIHHVHKMKTKQVVEKCDYSWNGDQWEYSLTDPHGSTLHNQGTVFHLQNYPYVKYRESLQEQIPKLSLLLLLPLLLSCFSRVRSHRRQPTRLPHPWDTPGKNTGVGCHFLLQCVKVKSESEVAQSCLTPSNPMDCSLPGSSIRGIFQARVLEWGAMALSQRHHANMQGKTCSVCAVYSGGI